MAPRIALPTGVALYGSELSACFYYSTPLRRQASTRPAPRQTNSAVQNYSTSPVPIIRGDIDDVTGRLRVRTPSPSRRPPTWSRRFPKYLARSPNETLALRLKSQTRTLDFKTWQRFDEAARSRSLRLPVVALQMMIRQDEAQRPTSLSDSLCDEKNWRTRLNSLAFKGISEADVRHWVWILSAQDADERIARFVAPDAAGNSRPKPVFLLFQLLRRDDTFTKGSSLVGLYRYIRRHHVQTRMVSSDASLLPFGAVRRTLDPGLNTTPQTFATMMQMLVHHYLRLWPSALPAVATLIADYVKTIPHMAHAKLGKKTGDKTGEEAGDRQAYADMCQIFNYGLVLFQQKAPVNPVSQMRCNWRAQKVLLAMSASVTPRPLMINRAGFRAIRRVLLALGKSPDERRVSMRMARTWPPYRRDWDGLDEQRRPQDDFSRSVQAGVMMHEAGYADMEHDRALSVLGGVLPGEAPTVQTRSLSPRTWTGAHASSNVFSTWAARVKATRDVNEAWHEFQTAPPSLSENGGSGGAAVRPNTQVYAEMFKKLVAGSVGRHHPAALEPSAATWPHGKELLPGDAKEVFPVNDATLTAFEKQRLRPPSVDALYAQMMAEGTRPVGDCLSVLVQNAPLLKDALRYLYDSQLDKTAIAALKLPPSGFPSQLSPLPLPSSPRSPLTSLSPFLHGEQHFGESSHPGDQQQLPPPLSLDLLRQIPLSAFNAYIHCMCRAQPRLAETPARSGKQWRAQLIHHAIRLCTVRLPATTKEGRTYRAPWHTILRTLSQPKLMVGPEHTTDRQFHDAEALAISLQVFEHVRQTTGSVDGIMFDSLCKTAGKYLRWVDAVAPALAVAREEGFDLVGDKNTEEAAVEISDGGCASAKDGAAREKDLLQKTQATLVAAFDELIYAVGEELDGPLYGHPSIPHNITAGMVHRYMQNLGYLGDTGNMTRAMAWVVRMWDDETVLEDAKDVDHGQHGTIGRALVMFRAFVEGQGPLTRAAKGDAVEAGETGHEVVAYFERQFQQLHARGCTWRWPSAADADEYVRWHRHEYNTEFWDAVRPVD